jgi:hypothetical protein
MSWAMTESGHNMYDMLSMLQKSIRRRDYNNAGYAAFQLRKKFRRVMWNRLFVISAEDCFGVLTKELVRLKEMDDIHPTDRIVANAVATLCRSKKSRDACYFSCNFVLASRESRKLTATEEEVQAMLSRIPNEGETYSKQMTIEDMFKPEPSSEERFKTAVRLQKALRHRDMDMVGFHMDKLRYLNRNLLWNTFEDYADRSLVRDEVKALRKADDIVNHGKEEKDEIFISKCAVLLMHNEDDRFDDIRSSDVVSLDHDIDWTDITVKPLYDCMLGPEGVPEWVFDCHTLKGKRLGKTDWDMTTTEQAALTPLQKAYFDEASWIYTYQWDYEHGIESREHMMPIWEYAETHEANPIEYIPYDDSELSEG